MFRQKSQTILPTTQPSTTRPNLQPVPSSTSSRSPLTTAATYLSTTWAWLLGARYVYIVSLHDFASYTPQHTVIGCFSTQTEADVARDRAIEGRQSGGRSIWRRYEEIEDGEYGTMIEDRDGTRCDVMGLVERVRVG